MLPTPSVVIVGGCGRVGLPLGVAFAASGARTVLYDVSAERVKLVNDGTLPFDEPGAAGPLRAALRDGLLSATTDAAAVGDAGYVVVVLGTPVDAHLNPDPRAIPDALALCADHLADGQLLVLRSTVYPGVTRLVERMLADLGKRVEVAFCPERIAEGRAMEELRTLPQIVAARTPEARDRAAALFLRLAPSVVHLDPEEAELAKLFTNAWRYVKFATANQLFMIANDFGLDYERIRRAIAQDYPRAADLPGAGFAAGPCLFKDTAQLAAFNDNVFALGHAAMHVNEGLPLYVVSRMERRFDLAACTVGILGMAFKAGSDDTRSSLSYKLRRILEFKAAGVLCTDPLVTSDPTLRPLDEVLDRADVLVVGTPHDEYRSLRPRQPVVDIWDVLGNGARA